MRWFNNERLKNLLTFPVETANMHTIPLTKEMCEYFIENDKFPEGLNTISPQQAERVYADSEMADFFAEMWAEGASFFMYQSDSVDSLSSCCRLRNGIEDNTFSYTLGAGGIETGSKGVITMNLNRIVQD